MKTAAKKRKKPTARQVTQRAGSACSICNNEEYVGVIAAFRVGEKCLRIVEDIARANDIHVPLFDFTPRRAPSAASRMEK